MGKVVSRIVLTGGPCAGKTSALSYLEQNLTEQGYRVFIVPESATELIKGGIRPFGLNPINLIEFQKLILTHQLQKENLYEQAAKLVDGKCVIIYDRGLLDNKSYIKENEFAHIIKEKNEKEIELLNRYDMVIHLLTAAYSKNYTTENNTARTETKEEAIDLDQRTLKSWTGHHNLKIVKNYDEFDQKLKTILNLVNNQLGNPEVIRKERKFVVSINDKNFEEIKRKSVQIEIEQHYIENTDFEHRIRKTTIAGYSCYYETIQTNKDGVKNIIRERKIKEKDFNRYLEGKIINSIYKTRYAFTHNGQYYRLDIFKNNDINILEIDPTIQNTTDLPPNFIEIIKEVTNDQNFQNIKIKRLK